MTDRPLVEKRLAIIDTSLAELRRLAPGDRIDVDLAIVRDVVTNHLDDLARFAEGIRRRLRDEDAPPDGGESPRNA